MSSLPRQRDIPVPPAVRGCGEADDLRRMVLLLETADVLATRARRSEDPVRRSELMRRAGQRRREAAGLRESLVVRGAATAVEQVESTSWPARQTAFGRVSPPGGGPRT